MSEDTRFAAYGKAPYAFYTDPTLDDDGGPVGYGVNVQALTCGVYGQSLAQSADREVPHLDPNNPDPRYGVYGTGDNVGVYGRSRADPNRVVPQIVPDPGTGVFGIADNVGIRGQCTTGIGVLGEGESGVGGVFSSVTNRGGVFSSGHEAQLQLTPQLVPPNTAPVESQPKDTRFIPLLPKDGQAGDIFAATDERRTELCQLWFCVRSSNEHDPAQWRQVTLGSVIVVGES